MATTDIRGAVVDASDPPIGTSPNPGLAIKAPVKAATTGANILLSGLQTVDGVALNAGDRVLVKDQTDQTTNGIYNAATGNWVRAIDAANNSQWANGTQILVTSGTENGDSVFVCQAPAQVVLGTSILTFTTTITPNISIEYVIDGGGIAIATGLKGFLEIPFGCTVLRWSLLADQSGSIVIDVWDAPFAAFPPTPANSITGSAKPTLASQQSNQSSALTGWSPELDPGDILAFNVVSASLVQRVTLSLYCSRP